MFVDCYSYYFTIKLHYRGRFRGNTEPIPKMSDYVDGKVDYIDNCEKDLMSLIELDHMLFRLGYKDCMGYYYANKNEELVWC